MKHLFEFKKFVTPALKIEVEDYVTSKMNSGDVKEIFDAVGEKFPTGKNKEEFEEITDRVKEKAIQHFIKFPESMRTGKGLSIQGIPVKSGRMVPRLTNIGGVSK